MEEKGSFNEKKIVLTFGAVSDIHIGNAADGRDRDYFSRALKGLREGAEKYGGKLTAIIAAGDLTESYGRSKINKGNEVAGVKAAYEAVLDPGEVPFVYVLGNHDHDFVRYGGAGMDLSEFLSAMGNEALHKQYDLPCADAANGSRHAVIGGYHFLFAEPITYNCEGPDPDGAKFTPETLQWLDSELARITEKEPNHYVFVAVHAMVYGTVYGSELLTSGIYWYTKEIRAVLEKYPQAVVFGGHLHFPLNDPRSIMQDKFTALGCGSVNYMAIEDGGYEHMAGKTVMKDRFEFSQGLLCQLDKCGNLRVLRMDFYHDAVIGEPLILPHPREDGTHLLPYSRARGEKNLSPVLSEMQAVMGEMSEAGREVTIRFAAAEDDEFAHHYVLTVSDEAGDAIMTKKLLSDFYRHANTRDMAKEQEIGLGALPVGKVYTARLTAVDSWGAESEAKQLSFEPKI